MGRYTVTEGIVIRRKVLPSGDVVATLLSRHGKWRGIGRKGRVVGGNLGRLSLFHDVSVQYYRRREDDLALLTQVTLNGALPNLSRPEIYPYAHLLAELTDAMTMDVHLGDQAYTYLASGFRGLDQHPQPERVALAYAWRMLSLAGMAPRTDACVVCGSTAALTHLDVSAGGLTCEACRRGIPIGTEAARELHRFGVAGLRTAIDAPLSDSALHWRLLARYLSFHVHELRSLAALEGAAAMQHGPEPAEPGRA